MGVIVIVVMVPFGFCVPEEREGWRSIVCDKALASFDGDPRKHPPGLEAATERDLWMYVAGPIFYLQRRIGPHSQRDGTWVCTASASASVRPWRWRDHPQSHADCILRGRRAAAGLFQSHLKPPLPFAASTLITTHARNHSLLSSSSSQLQGLLLQVAVAKSEMKPWGRHC